MISNSLSREFQFTIVNPHAEDKTTTVKAVIEGDKCPEFGAKGNGQKGQTQPIIATVVTVVLVSLLINHGHHNMSVLLEEQEDGNNAS